MGQMARAGFNWGGVGELGLYDKTAPAQFLTALTLFRNRRLRLKVTVQAESNG